MILPFIIAGLVAGSVYGLSAVGLVLTYKTSNLFNFAQGALAAAAAYVFYTLHVQHGWAWPLAAVVAVFVLGPLLALFFERLAMLLAGQSLALKVAATVGVLLVIESVITLIYGTLQSRTVPVFLGRGVFHIGGTAVQVASLVTFLFSVIATAALYAFFRFTRTGSAMRAVVDDPNLLELSGTSSRTVRRYAWLIGTLFACATGVLFSALLPLDPTQLTLLVVSAFGAAAIGAFTSLPLTFVGGLVIGVLASLATKYFTSGVLAGLPASLPFLVLFVVLLVFPRRYLAERSRAVPTSRPTWVTPLPVQLGGALVLLVFLALVPSFAGIHLTDWTTAIAYVVLFLSLGLLVRTAGQVSLGHIAFLAIGATTFGHLAGDGVPWLLALLLTALIAVPVGALLSIPAIRLTPLYLALATFGFAILVQYMFYSENFMFGSTGAGVAVAQPGFLGSDAGGKGYYYLVLGLAVLAAVWVLWVERSRLGRLLRGMADSTTAVATSGATTTVTWVLVFCISAALAAVAGALSGAAQQTVSLTSYPPLLSLTYLALVMIVVGGTPWYAVMAGLALIVPPSYITSSNTSYWLQLIFGVSAVLYAVQPAAMRGAPPFVQRHLDRLFRRSARSGAVEAAAGGELPPVATEPVAPGTLEVAGLTVRFGGLVAVEGLSLSVATAQITGLIGPNGAGKTTTFNACSGLVSPSSGTISLDGRNITSMGPAHRAQLGIGRTFQRMELFDSLTVRENVAMGAEALLAGANPVRHLIGRRGDRRKVAAAAAEAMRLCDIEQLAPRSAGALSTGQRRLVELARCLAGSQKILLLDEPSSGLDHAETAAFGRILQRAVEDRKLGILLVEHDMSLVMEVCKHIYVLDFGRLIFEGTPPQVVSSPIVQAAYLDEEKVEDAAGSEVDAVSAEGAAR